MEQQGLQPQNQPPEGKPASGVKIVGINLGVFVAYTLLSMLTDGGFLFAGILMIVHVFVCIILALYYRKWSWVLGGLLVLIIGFSTCVSLVRF